MEPPSLFRQASDESVDSAEHGGAMLAGVSSAVLATGVSAVLQLASAATAALTLAVSAQQGQQGQQPAKAKRRRWVRVPAGDLGFRASTPPPAAAAPVGDEDADDCAAEHPDDLIQAQFADTRVRGRRVAAPIWWRRRQANRAGYISRRTMRMASPRLVVGDAGTVPEVAPQPARHRRDGSASMSLDGYAADPFGGGSGAKACGRLLEVLEELEEDVASGELSADEQEHARHLITRLSRRLQRRAKNQARRTRHRLQRQRQGKGKRCAANPAEAFVRDFWTEHRAELAQKMPNAVYKRAPIAREVLAAHICEASTGSTEAVFHGTKAANVPSIMRVGLAVPGTHGVSVANGSVYGVGIYVAHQPWLSSSYQAQGAPLLVCSLVRHGRGVARKTDVISTVTHAPSVCPVLLMRPAASTPPAYSFHRYTAVWGSRVVVKRLRLHLARAQTRARARGRASKSSWGDWSRWAGVGVGGGEMVRGQ